MTIVGHTDIVKAVARVKKRQLVLPTNEYLCGWDDSLTGAECGENHSESPTCCRGHARSVDSLAIDSARTKFCSGSCDKKLKIWSAVPTDEEDELEESTDQEKNRKQSS